MKLKRKQHNVTPTRRQRLAVQTLVASSSKKEGLTAAGYSKAIAKQPHKVIESKGFIKALEEIGLTDDFLNKALFDDIKMKPKQRLGELTLAYKLKGKLSDTKDGNKTLILNISGQASQRYLNNRPQ